MFGRWVEPLWKRALAAPYVHLVFGARQTGKSTLLRTLLPEATVWLDFSRPAERSEHLRNPDLLIQRCRALPKSRRPATSSPARLEEIQSHPETGGSLLAGSGNTLAGHEFPQVQTRDRAPVPLSRSL